MQVFSQKNNKKSINCYIISIPQRFFDGGLTLFLHKLTNNYALKNSIFRRFSCEGGLTAKWSQQVDPCCSKSSSSKSAGERVQRDACIDSAEREQTRLEVKS